MIRWFCAAHLSLCITRWSPWKRSSEETLLKWSWSKRDVIRFSVAVVSGLDETQCVGNVHNKLAVGVLMSSTSWPARPSTLVFLFSNHFNINSSAIFVTWRPNYDIFSSEFCKNGFFSAFFHLPYTVNSLYSGHCRDLKLVSSVARVRNSGSLFQSNVCNSFLPGIYLLSVLSGCPL